MHHTVGKHLLKQCHIHATSEREAAAINALFKPKSITILPNFVKLPLQKKFPEHSSSSIIKLLFFSRIEEKKGLDILLSALNMVNVPYSLTIAGGGEEAYIHSLKKKAADHQIEDKVNWIGFQNENKFELLQAHDLFVLPSYDENFGNVVIESLCVGTPVLISEQVGLAGYVKQNNLGWICNTDPSSIANEINNIFNKHKNDLHRIRETAPKTITSDFKDEHLIKRYINLYDELIIK